MNNKEISNQQKLKTRVTQSNPQIQKEQTNTEQHSRRRNVNQHISANQRQYVTLRKNQKTQKQNTNNLDEYWIDNIPPELTKADYPPINKSNNATKNRPTTKEQQQPEITVIQETPFSLLEDTNETIEFMSPPVITISTTTPQTVNTSTPSVQSNKSTKPKFSNTQLLNPEL